VCSETHDGILYAQVTVSSVHRPLGGLIRHLVLVVLHLYALFCYGASSLFDFFKFSS
jgi:hypothetical protein